MQRNHLAILREEVRSSTLNGGTRTRAEVKVNRACSEKNAFTDMSALTEATVLSYNAGNVGSDRVSI